jgi:hypothetical protein
MVGQRVRSLPQQRFDLVAGICFNRPQQLSVEFDLFIHFLLLDL